MNIERIGVEEWGNALPSSGFEVFHTSAALSVIAEHADTDIRLYAARKGQEMVGLLPVFVSERSVGKTVTSPPTGLGVPRLGPILMPNSPKRRKRERINDELVAGMKADLDADDPTTLVRIVSPLAYDDPRSFVWKGFDVQLSSHTL